MSCIVLGTPKWRELERWESICEKYKVKFALEIKKSRIGFENSWYLLSMYVPNDIERNFLNDVHNKWKPYNQRHQEL